MGLYRPDLLPCVVGMRTYQPDDYVFKNTDGTEYISTPEISIMPVLYIGSLVFILITILPALFL